MVFVRRCGDVTFKVRKGSDYLFSAVVRLTCTPVRQLVGQVETHQTEPPQNAHLRKNLFFERRLDNAAAPRKNNTKTKPESKLSNSYKKESLFRSQPSLLLWSLVPASLVSIQSNHEEVCLPLFFSFHIVTSVYHNWCMGPVIAAKPKDSPKNDILYPIF